MNPVQPQPAPQQAPEDPEAVQPEAGQDPETEDELKSTYWAAASKEDIGNEVKERVRDYFQTLLQSGMIELWRSVTGHYYGLSPDGGHETSKIVEFGDDGEKLGVRSNQLRSLVRYVHTTVTADRPATKPMASNGTAKALAQIPTARRVLDYYTKTKRMERHLKGTVLRALLYGKGYLWQAWDPSAGRVVQHPDPVLPGTGAPPQNGTMPTSGRMLPEGDLIYKACSPLEMVCDLDRDAYDHDWFTARRRRNKYDMAEIFASGTSDDQLELREKILALGADAVDNETASELLFGFRNGTQKPDPDTCYEYHFMHRKTPALPAGRYTIMIGDGLVLFDGPLPYDRLPVDEMVPEEFLGAGSCGYASAWDLLGMQQAYDALLSTCITNFDAFGHNDILLPEGVELAVEEIRDGLNVIRFPAGEHNRPSMLEKFSVKEEVFKLRDWIKGDMEVNSGVNATARGEPEASLKSGTALALVDAKAVHFQSGVMAAYTQLIEDSGTNTLLIIKAYVKTDRIAAISGTNDPDGLKAFKGADVSEIDRIEVEQVNPIFHTLAGKFDIANNLLERGLLTDIGQYYQVLETGRLETVMDPARQENLYNESVKEALLQGPAATPSKQPDPVTGQPIMELKDLPVVITDDPVLSIRAAKHVLDSIENRKNAQIVIACTTHIQSVLRVWRAAPKDLLQLLGYPMPPPLPGDPLAADPNTPPPGDTTKAPPGGKPKPGAGAPPPTGVGTQPDQNAPDKGSGMPSLPKPATPPSPSDS